jgi:ESS family glutamate:Na+ symporter
MLGATANAMANLNAVTKRYGPVPRAYRAVPLVGCVWYGFLNAGAVTAFRSYFMCDFSAVSAEGFSISIKGHMM